MVSKKIIPRRRDLNDSEKESLEGDLIQQWPYKRVGYAYVPVQSYGRVFNPRDALLHGTLFPILVIPWNKYVPKIGEEDYDHGW